MKRSNWIIVVLMMILGFMFEASAAMPMKHKSMKYGAGDEAVFTSGVVIYKILFTGQTSATQMDLYNAVTKTGSPIVKFEAPTSDKTETIDFGEDGVTFTTGLYADVTNSTDSFTVIYS